MYGLSLVVMFMVALVGLSMTITMDAAEARYEQRVQTLAENVSVYMGFAKRFRKANPSFSGSVSDASLSLPSWYGKQENMQLYMTGGRLYIYLVGVTDAQSFDSGDYIRERTEIASYGEKIGGRIVSVDGVSYSVPSQVPEGAFVYVI